MASPNTPHLPTDPENPALHDFFITVLIYAVVPSLLSGPIAVALGFTHPSLPLLYLPFAIYFLVGITAIVLLRRVPKSSPQDPFASSLLRTDLGHTL